jgi:hypothetical protein
MDEGKKSEASEEGVEQWGPYQLQEQVSQSECGQEELYLAVHETSGATALVLKVATKMGATLLKNWRVILSASDSPGYVAMQVEQTPWARALNKQSMESLVFTFEEVHEGVLCMARAVLGTHEPRPRWRLGLALASAAAMGALLFALVRPAPVPLPPIGPEPLANTPPVSMSHDVQGTVEKPAPFASHWLADTTSLKRPALAMPLPREPFKGQKRPPCTRYVQVELVGACWAPHKLKAPCPDELYEYQGECYSPILASKPPPQSLGQ